MQLSLRGAIRPVAGENRRRPTNANLGGTRQDKRTYGCFSIGRPPRTLSNVAETKEEQQMGLEKLGFGEEDKK